MTYYYDSAQIGTTLKMSEQLLSMINHPQFVGRDIIILCIGSDRSTGDSLGPVVGYKLQRHHIANVYGTLCAPVHASNLSSAIHIIHNNHLNPFIIAIDASLGVPEHIGYITLGNGPLIPGLGVKKKLPEVGDIHITGIVNVSNSLDCNLLQTTHLSTVIQIADILENVLCLTLQNCASQTNVYSYKQQSPDQLYLQRLTS